MQEIETIDETIRRFIQWLNRQDIVADVNWYKRYEGWNLLYHRLTIRVYMKGIQYKLEMQIDDGLGFGKPKNEVFQVLVGNYNQQIRSLREEYRRTRYDNIAPTY